VSLLVLSGVTMRFGGLVAVNDLTLSIEPGQLYGLIGPNGAGKTTVFNVITGVYRPTGGSIQFDGAEIAGDRSGRITRRGIARTFQNIRLFGGLTVLENVKVAFHCRQEADLAAAVFRTPTHRSEEARVDAEGRELLKIFHLESHADEKARNLPYGSQRRLEIARAMATSPRILLLDEPAAGMNPQESHELMDLIRWVRDHFGMAVLLVEHNMKVVMGICETVHVLDYGSTIAIGKPSAIQANPKVIEAYLGGA
jgi:branched-chain amino acid transport system ATP-binding protein